MSRRLALDQFKPANHRATGAEGITGPRSIAAVQMLRVSVTDRCNFRCTYCMPAEGLKWLGRNEILSFEEIDRVVRAAFHLHGIRHIKLTGGEPTVRRDLPSLVRRLRDIDSSIELSMTTNGFALSSMASELVDAGLRRVTVSLDSLRPDRFAAITRTGKLPQVLAGIDAALAAGFERVKINCVVVRGTNDDELIDFARLTLDRPITVRFIEYMPMGDSAVLQGAGGNPFEAFEEGGSTRYRIADDEIGPAGGCGAQQRGSTRDVFVSETQMRQAIESELGPIESVRRDLEPGVGPATIHTLSDAAGRLGFISAMSQPFCATCNRLRLTAAGVLRSCLFEGGEVDLKPILRSGGDLGQAMIDCVALKPDVHSARGNIQMSQIGG